MGTLRHLEQLRHLLRGGRIDDGCGEGSVKDAMDRFVLVEAIDADFAQSLFTRLHGVGTEQTGDLDHDLLPGQRGVRFSHRGSLSVGVVAFHRTR